MLDLKLLQKLCDSYGISGNEDDIRDIILSEISPFASEIKVDNLGNIIALKRGQKSASKKLMLSAHMDEVGLIVTFITNDGLLKFSTVGGINSDILCGKRVIVGDKHTPGVIGVVPIHLLNSEERKKIINKEDLYIDIGADTREEALKYVSIGDCVYFPANYVFEHNMIKSKAIDDRIGCFILINLIKQDLMFDTYFVFTVQEEIGLRGAKVATFNLEPDSAIVVEATTASDIKNTPVEKQVCKVGDGAVVSFMDKRTIYDKEYYNLALKLAKENNIKVQIKSAVAGGNDAGAIHCTRTGVKTIAISLPCRYIHAPCSMISYDDILNTQNLVKKLSQEIAGSK